MMSKQKKVQIMNNMMEKLKKLMMMIKLNYMKDWIQMLIYKNLSTIILTFYNKMNSWLSESFKKMSKYKTDNN